MSIYWVSDGYCWYNFSQIHNRQLVAPWAGYRMRKYDRRY